MNIATGITVSDGILTPSERVEALMEAFTRQQSLERAADTLRLRFDGAPEGSEEKSQAWDQWDEVIHIQMCAEGELIAHVKILMGNGILDRAAKLLRANPGGSI